jgi:hypothetical protein
MLNFSKSYYKVQRTNPHISDDYDLIIQISDPTKGKNYYKTYKFSGYVSEQEAKEDAQKKLDDIKKEHEVKTNDIMSPDEFSSEMAKLKAYIKRSDNEKKLTYDEFIKLNYPT